MPVKSGGENDMRFIYCACCISYILDDWQGINVEKATEYIRNSLVRCFVFLQYYGACKGSVVADSLSKARTYREYRMSQKKVPTFKNS